MGSFNSPVYFNVGIFPAYGSAGSAENFIWDSKAGRAAMVRTAFVHPQASACFIQDVKDDLISIFDLVKSEAKLFKYGSGSGTNFSRLRARGEPLEGGGESTGLISYLEVFDKAAQAIKSGGTTRRAAKMVVLDADHPEVLEFIRWKMVEERKARVLLANGYSGGMDGEAFHTVSGQNSNNSLRVSDEFMRRAESGGDWDLRFRKSGKVARTLPAKDILHAAARAAWECADPGIHYQDNIQKWHMCPAGGEIRSSNPCSEYLFLDDSACNLASLNLVAFLRDRDLDWDSFKQAVRILLFSAGYSGGLRELSGGEYRRKQSYLSSAGLGLRQSRRPVDALGDSLRLGGRCPLDSADHQARCTCPRAFNVAAACGGERCVRALARKSRRGPDGFGKASKPMARTRQRAGMDR